MALTACAASMVLPDAVAEELLPDAAALQASLLELGLPGADMVIPTRVDPQMRAWLEESVEADKSDERRLRQLLNSLLDADGLGLKYDADHTGTASEVFASRTANCLGFVQLFVALAREMDVGAYYLSVKRQPSFRREGDLVVVWEHVTAGFGSGADRLVLDFTLGPSVDVSSVEPISDLTALAMFYSNRGAEQLRLGEPLVALEWLEISVQLDTGWPNSWLNLGVARRRSGDLDGAETAYRRAIEVDPGHPQAYNNLATLLRLRNHPDAAREILTLLDRREIRDPFVHLTLGDDSLQSGRLEDAKRYYLRAYRIDPDQPDTRAALGEFSLAKGRTRRARAWLRKAERLAPDNQRVQQLRRRLDKLDETPAERLQAA